MSGQRVEGRAGPVIQLRMTVEQECLHELGKCSDRISELVQAASALESKARLAHAGANAGSACDDAQVLLPAFGRALITRCHRTS